MPQERQEYESSTIPLPKKTIEVAYADTDSGAYHLSRNEQTVVVNSTDGAITLYLPPVASAEGKIYSVFVRTYISAVYVYDYNSDSEDFHHHGKSNTGSTAKWTLDAANEGLLFYSDGVRWWVIASRGIQD